jgi:hypothetical protein
MTFKLEDNLTRDGAQRLVTQIKDYWYDRGYLVEPYVAHDVNGYFVVRSNLGLGMPPRLGVKIKPQKTRVG